MDATEAIKQLDAFAATGDELEDVSALDELSFEIEDAGAIAETIPAILRLFERNETHALGQPGPMIYLIQNLEAGEYIDQLIESLARKPALMSIRLLNEVLGGPMEREDYDRLLAFARELAAKEGLDAGLKSQLDSMLENHDQ